MVRSLDSTVRSLDSTGAGGLLVGALRLRHDRDTPNDLEDALLDLDDALAEDAVPPPGARWLIRATVLGIVSLAFGASLGPEAPLIALATGFGDRIARILRVTRSEAAFISSAGAVSGLFGGPLAAVALPLERGRAAGQSVRLIGAGLVAGLAGLVTMLLVLPDSVGRKYELTYVDPGSGRDLLDSIGWSALAAVPAALVGLVLGVCGAVEGLSLFSGEHQGQELIDSAGEKAATAFLLVAVLKVVATLACLGTGWFGGQIFPSVFMGMAVGTAVAPAGDGADPAVLRPPRCGAAAGRRRGVGALGAGVSPDRRTPAHG